MRGPGQVHVPPDGPSTSGRSELSEKEERFEPDIDHRGSFRVLSEPEVHVDERFQSNLIPAGLWYEKNGRFRPLDGILVSAVIRRGMIIGFVEGGYLRPIYNENHKMVIIYENNKRVREITPQQAEQLRINQRLLNVQSEPNMSAGPNRPSGDRKGRRQNQQRYN